MKHSTPQRRALIVGATSGIGRALAVELHRQGWRIGAAGRRTELLDSLRAELGDDTATGFLDVTSVAAPQQLHSLIEALGGADLIVLVAGVGWQNPELDPAIELRTLETNALGFTRMALAAYHYFAGSGGGHLAAVTSIAGTKGIGTAPAYSATKRYQWAYLQALAQQAHTDGLKLSITDIRPGFVTTDLIKGSRFPMQLTPRHAARCIVRALHRRRRIAIIDWHYSLLTALWRLIPNGLWERLKLCRR